MINKRRKIIAVATFIIVCLLFLYTSSIYDPQAVAINDNISQVAVVNLPLNHRSFPVDANLFQIDSKLFKEEDYSNKISIKRLNKLFKVLKEKEHIYEIVLQSFDLPNFSDQLNKNAVSLEYQKFLKINDNQIEATDIFINYLKTKSSAQTLVNSLNNDRLKHRELTKVITIG